MHPMLGRFGAFLLLAVFVSLAYAANPRYDCTVSCTFVSDEYPLTGTQPVSCKLYQSGVLKASSPVVASATGKKCQVTATFAPGVGYSVYATGVDSTGAESGASNILVFDSAVAVVPLTPPTNLRITATAF